MVKIAILGPGRVGPLWGVFFVLVWLGLALPGLWVGGGRGLNEGIPFIGGRPGGPYEGIPFVRGRPGPE